MVGSCCTTVTRDLPITSSFLYLQHNVKPILVLYKTGFFADLYSTLRYTCNTPSSHVLWISMENTCHSQYGVYFQATDLKYMLCRKKSDISVCDVYYMSIVKACILNKSVIKNALTNVCKMKNASSIYTYFEADFRRNQYQNTHVFYSLLLCHVGLICSYIHSAILQLLSYCQIRPKNRLYMVTLQLPLRSVTLLALGTLRHVSQVFCIAGRVMRKHIQFFYWW